MALAAGTRIGAYEIAALIGVGGMGEVYRATDTNYGTLMAAGVAVRGAAFEPGIPVGLFQPRIWGGGTNTLRQQYDVAADGRFLVNVAIGEESTVPITLLMNWTPPAR